MKPSLDYPFVRSDELCLTLYYDVEEHRFFDDFGAYVDNIYRVVPPWAVRIFLAEKASRIFQVGSARYVELIWPDEEWLETEFSELEFCTEA